MYQNGNIGKMVIQIKCFSHQLNTKCKFTDLLNIPIYCQKNQLRFRKVK